MVVVWIFCMASAEGVRLELTERQKELLEIRVVCLSAAIDVMVRSVDELSELDMKNDLSLAVLEGKRKELINRITSHVSLASVGMGDVKKSLLDLDPKLSF